MLAYKSQLHVGVDIFIQLVFQYLLGHLLCVRFCLDLTLTINTTRSLQSVGSWAQARWTGEQAMQWGRCQRRRGQYRSREFICSCIRSLSQYVSSIPCGRCSSGVRGIAMNQIDNPWRLESIVHLLIMVAEKPWVGSWRMRSIYEDGQCEKGIPEGGAILCTQESQCLLRKRWWHMTLVTTSQHQVASHSVLIKKDRLTFDFFPFNHTWLIRLIKSIWGSIF